MATKQAASMGRNGVNAREFRDEDKSGGGCPGTVATRRAPIPHESEGGVGRRKVGSTGGRFC